MRGILFASAATSLTFVPNVSAAEDTDATAQKITITGSRIKRTDVETASPVQVITSSDMIDAGRFSVADALRSSTSNSFGSFVPSSGNTSQSQATVDLLGVGSERTLVLLDGKRLPGSPSLGGSSVNINQIPMAIVERIEILKDGGSAIYGSDAIAGVVNIILKKEFEGFNMNAGTTRPDDEGGDSNDFSFVTGISGDKGNITFGYEHAEQKPIFDRDRPYTASSIKDTDGNGILNDSSAVGISSYGATIKNPVTGNLEASPQCDTLKNTVPGFVGVVEDGKNQYCGYAYGDVAANQASTNRDSIFVNGIYEVADEMNIFTRAMITHNKSFGRYAPPAASWTAPVGNEHNRFDQPVKGKFRWHQVGFRDSVVDDYSQDYIAGLNGSLNDGAVEYEVYFHHNTTDNKNVGKYYLSYAGLDYNTAEDARRQAVIDKAIADGKTTDTKLLTAAEKAANVRATALREDYNRFNQWYGGLSFEAGELSGGAIGHYFGAETFKIDYRSTVDAQSEAGLVGGSSGNSSGRSRDIWAAFYEVVMPLTDELEMSVAARYDDYSDFGTETSPKVSFTYRPLDSLMVRASYGEGFRAPGLETLSQADSFSADSAKDYVTCVDDTKCKEKQYTTTRQANPNLKAETSKTVNLGIVWSPVDELNITTDFYNLKIDDAIRFVPIQDIVYMEMLGTPNPEPSMITVDRVTEGASSPVFKTSTINGPGLDITGTNINLTYTLESSLGQFRFNSETAYFFKYEEDSYIGGPVQDKAGWELKPEYRTQFTTSWSLDNHGFTWNMDFIPSTNGGETPQNINGQITGKLEKTGEDLDSFLIHNLTYSYDADTWGEYTLGVRNVTDEDPVLNNSGKYAKDYDGLYSNGHIGRVFTINGSWNF